MMRFPHFFLLLSLMLQQETATAFLSPRFAAPRQRTAAAPFHVQTTSTVASTTDSSNDTSPTTSSSPASNNSKPSGPHTVTSTPRPNRRSDNSGQPYNRNTRPRPNRGRVLRLTRPLMLKRIVTQIPGTEEEIYREASAPPDRSSRPAREEGSRPPPRRRPESASSGAPSAPGATGIAASPSGGGRPGSDPRRKFKRGGPDKADPRENRKSSLRVQTGRKGRAAELSQRRSSLKKRDRTAERVAKAEAAIERKTVQIPDGSVTVSELASIIDEKPVSVIKFLMTDLGIMASMTQALDRATSIAVAEGFGRIVGDVDEEDIDLEDSALATGYIPEEDEEDTDQVLRPPVVTIMGHVDHGKTSLLDAIRSTDVTAGEAGGITQHIAAYQVKHNDQKITFIDTPGHAAFTSMRERGANITDIVILVVAADDGVKEQTKDSIMCARQAGVPLIVAINKCDLDTADPVRVQTELTTYDVLTEDFGGEVLTTQISAKQKTGLDDLLDKIMLQAEIEDLKANPNRDAECIVVEANIEKGLGTVATALVKRGTIRVGDIFVAGETNGKVRALISTSSNKRMVSAGPSTPVRIVGFEGVPSAGDTLLVAPDEQTAKELAESRRRISRETSSSTYQSSLMDSVQMAFGATKETREMCVVVKADVQGSAEALTNALQSLKLENEEAIVTVKVLVSETGEVSKSDIAIASVTPETTVLAFNVAASMAAMDDARVENIPIEYYNIIYDAIESVESRMQEVLSPTPEGEYTGAANVQEVFNIGGVGNIAGCKCNDGTLKRGGNIRVMRGDKILTESKIKSLRNFKAEVEVIEAGSECGIGLLDFEDFQPGDVIECYVEKKK